MNYRKTMMMAGAVGMWALLAGSFVYGIAAGEGLRATPEHFDFGTIDEGTPAVTTAIIQNNGTTTVEITNVRTS